MKLRIYTLMVGLFILGVASGMLISLGVAKQQIRSLSSSSTSEVSSFIVKFLDRRLSLSAEQETAVETVLKKGEQEVLPLRREFRVRALSVIKSYQPQVAEHLDGDQKQELDKIVNGLLATWQLTSDPDATSN